MVEEAHGPADPQSDPLYKSTSTPARRILVVDDDLELCHVIVDTLKDRGYEAFYIQTAEEAWDAVEKDPPDLILLDLEIPHMGGFVFCQKVHELEKTRGIPVIFLTVRDSEFDRRTALSLGAELYMTKPFRRSHLLKEVEHLLAIKSGDMFGPSSSHLAKSPPGLQVPVPQPANEDLVRPSPLPAAPAAARPRRETVSIWKGLIAFLRGLPSHPAALRAKDWVLKHKPVALPLIFLVTVGLMWGAVALYQKWSSAAAKSKQAGGDEAGVISVNVMQAAPAPFQDVLTSVGTVAGGSEIELRFQTEGNLKLLKVREGDSVRDGQVIAQLDQTQVSIKLERARSEFYRYEKLYALGGVSKDRLDEARVQYEYAQSEQEKTVLRATQDGIFGDRGVEVGEFVTPQKKVGTLVSLNSVLVRVGVIEKEIDKIAPGQMVYATVDTYANVEFKGKVENISPLVQGQSKTLTVEARFPNEGKLLLPGMFARTRIVIHEEPSAITVPNDALEKTQAGYQLYLVGKEQKAEVRPVEVSYVAGTRSVISSGLQVGELVIIQKPQELKEGSPVKVVDVEKGGPSLPEGPDAGQVLGGQEPGH